MADQTEKPKLGTRPPLGLKRTVETGKVKQSFSHGRSNTVVVEVKKRSAPIIEDWVREASAKGVDAKAALDEFHAEIKKVSAEKR